MSDTSQSNYFYRPVFRRVLDSFGGVAAATGLGKRQFDPDYVLDQARKKTGLSDFGPPEVTEPLELLCRDYEEHAALTFAGRLAAHHHLIQLLSQRLLMVRDREKHPEIGQQKIDQPVFVLGLPRSGTTLLHGLLAQDPEHRCPMTWEVMFPSPPPKAEHANDDKRIAVTRGKLGWLDHLAPGFKTIHPVDALLPQECIAINAHSMISLEFHTTHHLPNYQAWFEQQDLTACYESHKRFLQHLQWLHPRSRWVLKAPDHLRGLDALLKVYPDAKIVFTHRDPLKVCASIASHGTVIRAGFSNHIEPEAIAKEWVRYWSISLDNALEARSTHPQTRFVDVFYQDLVSDTIAACDTLYNQLGLTLSNTAREAMTAFLSSNPQDKHGRHRYSLSQFGLDPDTLRKRFDSYYQAFPKIES